jgi:hypothetical protein
MKSTIRIKAERTERHDLQNIDATFVFRLQNEQTGQHDLQNTLKHWGGSRMYGDKQIAAIESSNRESFRQPTSIPSPFARIALVKTAFAEVAEHGDRALKAYQKIVSDSLDVGEILFTFDKWRTKVEILQWDKIEDLKKLNIGHGQLYKTLNTFLNNDAVEYNFDKMKCIYILKYKPTGEMIGATSPRTIFFSSANDMKEVDIRFNDLRKAFDDNIIPLSERSWEFQKYLYTWMSANKEERFIDGRSTSVFDEVRRYLEMQKSIIGRIEEIDALSTDAEDTLQTTYKVLRAPNIEVLGKDLHQNKESAIPYLTAEDLLEDCIMRLPYDIRKESFFDGNLQEDSKQTFLLPIKEKFFQYYTIEELKRSILISHAGDVVDVELRIDATRPPHKKRYRKSDGNIRDLDSVDCAIFPNVKFEDDKQAHYRFGLVCNFREKEKYSVEYVKINGTIDDTHKRYSVRNKNHSSNYQLKNYLLVGSNFDYIRISYNGTSGLIVPNMELKSGEKEFMFTVDFGTTNTHIEYRIGKDKILPFSISKGQIDEKQVHWLHGGEDYLREVFDEEYIPAYTDEEFKLPMRSALSYGEETNWNDVYPFEKASVDELYEKRRGYDYNKTITDLKWSGNADNKNQVKVYIESLMYLIRNKVVIGNGRLEKTKIRWFYPVSMERGRYNHLKSAWEKAYETYFGGDKENIIPITESIAPFEYYKRDNDANSLVTIDIGGGTTDIVISVNGSEKVDFITSFRFAANALFGDGYAENSRTKNGIVRQFATGIKEELKTKINENDDLFRIFDDLENKSSADMASFLFSLRHNKKVREAGENLAENVNLEQKLLDDETQKITFIIFYSAIIYHLALLMKAQKLQMPDKIVFSGNGSKVIHFFTSDTDVLRDYTKLIFEKTYGSCCPGNLEIIRQENPKEATCKGGFFVDLPETFGEIYRKRIILHSNVSHAVIEQSNNQNTYAAIIDEAYLNSTAEEAGKFIEFVFDLLPSFSTWGYKLNSTSTEIAKRVCSNKNRLDIHTRNGWRMKQREMKGTEAEEVIEETLFFYPLVGLLKDLNNEICEKNIRKG